MCKLEKKIPKEDGSYISIQIHVEHDEVDIDGNATLTIETSSSTGQPDPGAVKVDLLTEWLQPFYLSVPDSTELKGGFDWFREKALHCKVYYMDDDNNITAGNDFTMKLSLFCSGHAVMRIYVTTIHFQTPDSLDKFYEQLQSGETNVSKISEYCRNNPEVRYTIG